MRMKNIIDYKNFSVWFVSFRVWFGVGVSNGQVVVYVPFLLIAFIYNNHLTGSSN